MLLDPPVVCSYCKRRQALTLDHNPPLATHDHKKDSDCCRLIPSCWECQRESGIAVHNGSWRPAMEYASLEPEPEREGLSADDPRWRVPWLQDLLRVPEDAVWPRLMTVPHPRAVGSLGPEFCEWVLKRSGKPLRWWQKVVSYRLLEIDKEGELVWETMVLSTARQVGKSYWLRELCLFRIHSGARFGEPQDVIHCAKDLSCAKEVQRPARVWAKGQARGYKVREVNGQEEIEVTADGSRWMLRAKEAVYGYSVSMGVVDEAWHVSDAAVSEGLTPTMVERQQAQLILVSTAHRKATALMLSRRQVALAQLEVGDGDLLIEWSAPRECELDDRKAWRLASPHWSPRRERLIQKRYEAMLTGEINDPEEPDATESFRAQYLNIWPVKLTVPSGATEPLLPPGVWESLGTTVPTDDLSPNGDTGMETTVSTDGPIWVGLEDDVGLGASVACARRLPDGRIELDGWLRADWDSAVADAEALVAGYRVRRIVCGASLMDRLPASLRRLAEARGGVATRHGLALFRDLALTGQIVHDETTRELDETIALATVREAPTGLYLLAKGPTHMVRATVWALAEAHKPSRVPAIL